jgi:DNA-binding transcriptional MerR regulator
VNRGAVRNVSLQAPDRGALWAQLALTQTQLAEMTGLTFRQVHHWAERGYLTPSPENPDRYNGDAVDLCVLIKQALRAGMSLHRAVPLAQAYVTEGLADQLGREGVASTRVVEVVAALREAQAGVETTLAVLELVVPEEMEQPEVLVGSASLGPGRSRPRRGAGAGSRAPG